MHSVAMTYLLLDDILRQIAFLFDSCWPELITNRRALVGTYADLPSREALRIVLTRRVLLDRVVATLFSIPHGPDRVEWIQSLREDLNYLLLERVHFAFQKIARLKRYNDRLGINLPYEMPAFLIDLCVDRYGLDVILPSLTSPHTPFLIGL